MKLKLLCFMTTVAALGTQAMAAPLMFQAFLDGLSESPPNASTGTGFTLVTIDPVAHTMIVDVQFQDLISPTSVAHIHVINGPGDLDTTDTIGPVATTTPSFPGFPVGVTSGTFLATFDMTLAGSYRPGWITDSGGTTALAEFELFSAIMDGRAYLNIHSTMFPAGEIRGFLTPVPEPATLAALGLGLAALRRRRKLRGSA